LQVKIRGSAFFQKQAMSLVFCFEPFLEEESAEKQKAQ
jgi:hypothetical protein